MVASFVNGNYKASYYAVEMEYNLEEKIGNGNDVVLGWMFWFILKDIMDGKKG